jgi:spore coat polysaccharide biosynthesis protein SpsF
MRTVAIIQARMGSTRLPGKVLKDLAGQTVLARVVNRTRRAARLDEVVVATTQESADDAIIRECERLQVACFRGDEADVLDRYYRAAKQFSADAVVRITSDCPLIDPELIDATIRVFLDRKADYASNVEVRTYPRGLDTEVMTMQTLARAWRESTNSYQREHVTAYICENPGAFKLQGIENDTDCSRHRWTLDTPEDLQLLRVIYARFGGRDDFSWREVLKVVECEPALADINRHVVQKTV